MRESAHGKARVPGLHLRELAAQNFLYRDLLDHGGATYRSEPWLTMILVNYVPKFWYDSDRSKIMTIKQHIWRQKIKRAISSFRETDRPLTNA
jgi:hypothetical protein